jgi:hypothetical protein
MMTKQEYADYQAAVAAFMAREGIRNLSTGISECPNCKVPFDDHDDCPKCRQHIDSFTEPYYSNSSCDCCGAEAGDREDATGYNPTTKQVQRYSICTDCVYYAEYGRLDDKTMEGLDDA